MKLEREAGYYECPHCGHRYVPEGVPFWFAMHMGRTRYLKCPECGKRGWQKKVLSMD
jgi:DNA-directed RNA polymerase subunit RPC12/RpoP